ncbi:MAG: YARHG domain-containing protein [Deltaproteobacteria bacterium]|nr:YARHG domain-containing protein [Deltaproteobacteria bacterium]
MNLPTLAALPLVALGVGLGLGAAPQAVAATPSIAGQVIDESDCGGGGPSTYFFAGGLVVREDCGDDCPNISEGTWEQTGETVELHFTRAYVGKGKDPIHDGGARTSYQSYTAAVEKLDRHETIDWHGPEDDGCTHVRANDRAADVRKAFLRSGFVGRWAYTSERALTDDDLAGLSASDLELMRNEIYARYRVAFKNPRLKKHFAADPAYRAYYDNVSAFLSRVENDNVAAIAKAEKALKKK